MEGTAIDKPDDSRVEAQPVPPPSIRAWLANYRLWVADDERERSFASDEILAVRLRFAHDDQYLVILVSSVDEPIVGVAGFDSARSIAKALDRGVPPEGAELVFGEPPPFVDLGSLPDVATLSDPFAAIPFVTVDALPGRKVVTALGTVVGSTVRTRHIGAKFVAGARDVVGGEFRGFTRLLDEARREAIARMLAQAKDLGADAVVGFGSRPLRSSTGPPRFLLMAPLSVPRPPRPGLPLHAALDAIRSSPTCYARACSGEMLIGTRVQERRPSSR